MSIYLLNAKLNIKKLQYVVNNESETIANEEIRALTDYTTPIVKVLNPIVKASSGDTRALTGEQNEFKTLDLSSGDYYFNDVVNH